MSLMQIAFLALCAGASGGVFMTLLGAIRVRYPSWLGPAHGLAGLAGLALLYLAHLLTGGPEGVWWGLILITFALLGGLVLLRTIFANRRTPVWLALGHGGLAAAGLFLIYPLAFGA